MNNVSIEPVWNLNFIESKEMLPSVILDFDAEGKAVGIAIPPLSTRITPDQLKILQYEIT